MKRYIMIPEELAVDLKIVCQDRLSNYERQNGQKWMADAHPTSHVGRIREMLKAAEDMMLGRYNAMHREER